ncbi:MAG: DUF1573 domain-containing protein [Bacteroidota bacterium]
MKRNIIGLMLTILICYGQLLGQGIKFDETNHNFGNVPEGPPAKHTFTFTNVTDSALKLTYVKASCGCTTPSWTREEIAPGATGKIDVAYNTKGRPGRINKTVTVKTSSGEQPVFLRITGKVEKVTAEAPPPPPPPAPKEDIKTTVHFHKDAFKLDADAKAELDKFVTNYQAQKGSSITLKGHTDSDGGANLNKIVSEKRAVKVKDYLMEKGIPEGQITTIGAGETELINEEKTTAEKRQNRRVEIVGR